MENTKTAQEPKLENDDESSSSSSVLSSSSSINNNKVKNGSEEEEEPRGEGEEDGDEGCHESPPQPPTPSYIQLRPSKLLKIPQIVISPQPTATTSNNFLRPSRLQVQNTTTTSTSTPDSPKHITTSFVPLLKQEIVKNETVESSASASTTTNSTFRFGENLSQRVVKEGGEVVDLTGGVAAAGRKRKLEEFSLNQTGEEEEVNVMQMNVKLYKYSEGSYRERGRGLLRLNDRPPASKTDHLESRVIIRTQGSLRVLLNTKVWDKMGVEKAGEKSVRFCGIDSNSEVEEGQTQVPSVFLVMGTPGDMDSLYKALECRIRTLVNVCKKIKSD